MDVAVDMTENAAWVCDHNDPEESDEAGEEFFAGKGLPEEDRAGIGRNKRNEESQDSSFGKREVVDGVWRADRELPMSLIQGK